MTNKTNLPRQNSQATDSNSMFTREWFNYFRRLEDRIDEAENSVTTGEGSGSTTIINNLFVEPVIYDASTARTLTYSDAGTMIVCTNVAGITITVPPSESETIPLDSVIGFTQYDVGQVTLVAGSGVTIVTSDSLKSRTAKSVIGIKCISNNVWEMFGDIEPVAPALSVLVRASNSSGPPTWLQLTTEGHIPKRVSNAIVSAADGGGSGGSGNSYVPGGW